MTFNLDFLNLDLLKRYSRYTFLGVYLLLNLSLGIYLYQFYQTKIENQRLIREKRRELKDSSNAIQRELEKLKTEKQKLLRSFSYSNPYALATEIQKFLNQLVEKDRITVVQYQAQETKWHDYPQLRVRTILQGDINGLVKILNALETQRQNLRIRVQNGQTVVLGGLFKTEKTRTTSGIPLLKDIPLLGLLFGKKILGDHQNRAINCPHPTCNKDKGGGRGRA